VVWASSRWKATPPHEFGISHAGHFALTAGLLPSLAAAPDARIVNVSSVAHEFGKMDFENLQGEGLFGYWGLGWPAYGQSKLANLHFTVRALLVSLETDSGGGLWQSCSTPWDQGAQGASHPASGLGNVDSDSADKRRGAAAQSFDAHCKQHRSLGSF
jgi:hypothetical protein